LGKQLRGLIKVAVTSLEGLTSEETEAVRNFFTAWPECWRWGTDWWYCKDAVERIAPITKRFLKLSPILTRVSHRQDVNTYLREATKCYLYGFFQASTALFRTALETGLNDFLHRKLGPTQGLKLAANEAIHENPITEMNAFDVLTKTRCVLETLYHS
jgi:hypothetical protein